MSDDWKISVNVRPGTAPQVSIHADSAEEAYNILGEIQSAELIERVNDVALDYNASFNAAAGLGKMGTSQQPNASPAQSDRVYDPQGRVCSKAGCGQALYLIEGNKKNGGRYKAYGHDSPPGQGFGHDRHFI